MLLYCLKCRKSTESINRCKDKIGRLMLSKCEVCDSKKSKFMKEQEDGFFCNIHRKTFLIKLEA